MKWVVGGVAVYIFLAWYKGREVGAACFPNATGFTLNADQITANCNAAKARWAWFKDPSSLGLGPS